MNRTKPKPFAVNGKTHHLKSFWEDLKELGYVNATNNNEIRESCTTIQNNYPDSYTLDEYISFYINDSSYIPTNSVVFQLPNDYSAGLKYAKEALESNFWPQKNLLQDKSWYIMEDKNNTFLFKSNGLKKDRDGWFTEGYYEMYNSAGHEYRNDFLGFPDSKYRFATNDEVEERLSLVAISKGFVDGATFLTASKILTIEFEFIDAPSFHKDMGFNVYGSNFKGCVYDNKTGKWGEILKNGKLLTLSNGEKVNILSNKYIKADGKLISPNDLRILLQSSLSMLNDWSVTIVNVNYRIGCWENITSDDIKAILAEYDKK